MRLGTVLLSDEGRFDDVALGDNFVTILHRAMHDAASGAQDDQSQEGSEERSAMDRHG